MITRILPGRALAVVAGAAMLAATATSASAFTLSSPSLEPSVAGSNIEHVWWDHWHHWHGVWVGPGRPIWGGPGPGWRRHSWRGPMGHLHCN